MKMRRFPEGLNPIVDEQTQDQAGDSQPGSNDPPVPPKDDPDATSY